MKIDGHYDPDADIAWLRFAGFDPTVVVGEQTAAGCARSTATGRVVGRECWRHTPIRVPRVSADEVGADVVADAIAEGA